MIEETTQTQRSIWKDIPGYEGFYQASIFGDIRSIDRKVRQHKNTQLKRSKILSPAIDRSGYLQCALSCQNILVSFKVHQLIARTFKPNLNNYPEINHRDKNKLNNHISNLEWCTHAYNMRHSCKKLYLYQDWDIYDKYKFRGVKVKELALEYNVHRCTIQKAIISIKKINERQWNN